MAFKIIWKKLCLPYLLFFKQDGVEVIKKPKYLQLKLQFWLLCHLFFNQPTLGVFLLKLNTSVLELQKSVNVEGYAEV